MLATLHKGAGTRLSTDDNHAQVPDRPLYLVPPRAPAAAIFGMAFIMAKSVKMSRAAVVISIIVDWAQMLAFPVNSHPNLPWGDTPGVHTFSQLADFVTTDNMDQVRLTSALR